MKVFGRLRKSRKLQRKDAQEIAAAAADKMIAETFKPLTVSIMGQTGVGKSSLMNALFHTNLPTDPVQPCTKQITPVPIDGPLESHVLFYDLPGIGEAEDPDTRYLEQYREMLLKSDVVLWAIHADNRSVTFDKQALRFILAPLEPEHQAILMSKITLVLTKADLIAPAPWFLVKASKFGVFVPQNETKGILEQKAWYYQREFLQPYKHLMKSETYNDGTFDLSLPLFFHNENTVRYDGYLDVATLNGLKQQYPQHATTFDRLYANYQVIFCSSLFRFNLNKLLLLVINKLGKDAITRFSNFVTEGPLNKVPFEEAKKCCNIIITDLQGNKLFDLTKVSIEEGRI